MIMVKTKVRVSLSLTQTELHELINALLIAYQVSEQDKPGPLRKLYDALTGAK